MKARLFNYKFLLCAVVICGLMASPLLDIAQAQATRQSNLNEAAVVAQDDGGRPQVRCGGRPVIYTVGNTDNFAGVDPATLSPALNTFFVGKPRRNFDDGGPDKGFGQSFQLNACKICAATLELRIKDEQRNGLSSNDAVTVGVAPFTVRFGSLGPIWNSTDPLAKTILVPLSAAALNSYIMTNVTGQWWLDVYLQDDTSVDYAKLTVWYY
jgi:hypothetical protein